MNIHTYVHPARCIAYPHMHELLIDRPQKKMKAKRVLYILLLLISPFGSVCEPVDERSELHIAFITSFGGDFVTSESIPAVILATDVINAVEVILPGYKLVIDVLESDELSSFKKLTNSNVSIYIFFRSMAPQTLNVFSPCMYLIIANMTRIPI